MAALDHDQQLLQKVHDLNDLELAALLSLVAREHCLISTTHEAVDELTEELRLVAAKTFGLTSAVVTCHAHTTLDDFATSLLLVPSPQASSPPGNSASNTTGRISPFRSRHQPQHHYNDQAGPSSAASGSYFPPHLGSTSRSNAGLINTSLSSTSQSQPLIANVILTKHLDRAPRAVQIQALELLRTRRIFTRTSVQTAPKQFLFIAVVSAPSGGQARVTPHLNDFFYISHWHDPEDGFDYLDEQFGDNSEPDDAGSSTPGGPADDSDAASTSSSTSIIKHSGRESALGGSSFIATAAPSSRRSINLTVPSFSPTSTQPEPSKHPLLTETEVALLAQLSRQTLVSVDVARYQMNIVSFLRTHRAVGGGVTPTATKHFEQLMRSVAPLHGVDYVTPSLVALAARKVYLHRIKMVAPERERSMQWGSELGAVEAVLDGMEPEDVIEDVLSMVGVPT